MIRIQGTAWLSDGTSVAFKGGAREFSAWERYALKNGIPPSQNAAGDFAGLTMMYFLTYLCVTRGLEERPGFDDWLGTLDDVTDWEIEVPPPTRSGASGALSARSPLEQESRPLNSGTATPGTSLPSSTF